MGKSGLDGDHDKNSDRLLPIVNLDDIITFCFQDILI